MKSGSKSHFVLKDKQETTRKPKSSHTCRDKLFNAAKWWSDGILYPKGHPHHQLYNVMKACRSSEP